MVRGDLLRNFTDKGDDFARTFLATGTYGFVPGHPSAYTQPLYGWFLVPLYWVFGRHWEVVGLAHIAVSVATTLLVYELGRRALGAGAGVLGGLAVALHPYFVWHDVHMNREVLDHLLAVSIALLAWTAARRVSLRLAAALGAVLGLAILGNARLQLLPVVLAAFLLWRWGRSRRALAGAIVVIAASVVVVAPWLLRNRAELGCWAVTTDARALWKANNPTTYSTLTHGGWIDHVPVPASFPPTPQDVYERWQRTGVYTPVDECAQMSFYRKKVFAFWRDHPGEKAKLAALDARMLWQPSVVETTGRPGAGSWLDDARATAEPVWAVTVFALGVVGIFFVSRLYVALAALLLAYQTLVAMVFVGATRYRVPWDFLIALLAGAAVVELARRRSAGEHVLPRPFGPRLRGERVEVRGPAPPAE